jgi:hypothetical protein
LKNKLAARTAIWPSPNLESAKTSLAATIPSEIQDVAVIYNSYLAISKP